jgi:hypothetical protein
VIKPRNIRSLPHRGTPRHGRRIAHIFHKLLLLLFLNNETAKPPKAATPKKGRKTNEYTRLTRIPERKRLVNNMDLQ